MKRNLLFVMLMIVGLLSASLIFGQARYTPYDELPTIPRSDKPAYSSDYPDWAKMLYNYPVNFNEINNAFEKYMSEHKGAKNPIIRYYKMWRRTVSSFVKDDGTIQLPNLNNLNKAINLEQLKASSKLKGVSLSNSNWTFLGPKETFWLNSSGSMEAPGACPWQVNVYALDVAPSDSSILYVGTETGLVNKSTDKGETWQLLGRDYPFGGAADAVVIHPTNPDIVYIGGGKQIHKTSDGGYNWEPMLPANGLFGANHIKINPDDPSKMIASSSYGIYVSIDAGENWTKKWPQATWDIEYKYGNTDFVYAISKDNAGIYTFLLSTNGGASFSEVSSFPANIKESSGGLVAVTPANPNLVFVTMLAKEMKDGTEQNVPFIYKGVYDGTDFIWTQTKKGIVGGGSSEFSNGQGYFDLVLEVSPLDENLVFWGTCNLWKSTNGGYYYTKIGGYGGDYSIHPDIQSMKMLSNGDTWVATDGGINYTTDNFSSQANYHVRIKGLIGSDMWGFDQGWNEDIVVGGRYHNGNTAIADFYGDKALRMGGAESPTGWVLQGKSRHVAFNDLGNGWILPQTAEGAPEGRFMFSKYPNMDEYGGRRSNLLHHSNYYDILYVGEGNGFWRSMDGGVIFDLLQVFSGRVMYMEISHTNPDVIYVDVKGYGLYRSADGGVTWERKNSLTNGGSYGDSSWNGKLFFAISPYNEDVIYACLSYGWWTGLGSIYRSANGGDTWVNWTSGLSEYMENIVIQPTTDGVDLVYLFTTASQGKPGSVYYRRADETTWTNYDFNYPVGMRVNLGLPFYRDSKLRVGGSASVWESPMQEEVFTPIVNPWCQKKEFDCVEDTVYFDDHSILNHEGATWHWDFYPDPDYISNPDVRNPTVLFGDTISYDVTLTVTKDGQEYIKTVPEMVSFSSCPSINDCNNPAELPKSEWTLLYFDSEQTGIEDGAATNAIDGDPATKWHTQWSGATPPYPHELQVDLGGVYMVHSFTYLPRQDGGSNGTVKDYELYVSEDRLSWGTAVSSGFFESNTSPKTINFDEPVAGKYFKFKALSEINDGPWASAAEFTIVGCYKPQTGIFDNSYSDDISAYPVPTDGKLNLSVFTSNAGQNMKYTMYSIAGQVVDQGQLYGYSGNYSVDLSAYSSGIYFIVLVSEQGVKYRVKIVKK